MLENILFAYISFNVVVYLLAMHNNVSYKIWVSIITSIMSCIGVYCKWYFHRINNDHKFVRKNDLGLYNITNKTKIYLSKP